jgi:hypothetical protein
LLSFCLAPVQARAVPHSSRCVVSELEGFTVFNQAHNGLTTPQSPVPLYASGMSVSYYRLGSNMRVPLKASSQVVALGTSGASVKTPLAWDFVNNQITTAAAAGFAGSDIATTAMTYANGVATATTASAHGLTAGQYVKISGAFLLRTTALWSCCRYRPQPPSPLFLQLHRLAQQPRRHHRRSYAVAHHAASESARHRGRQLEDCQL